MLLRVVIGSTYAEAEVGTRSQLVSPEYIDTLLNRLTDACIKGYATKRVIANMSEDETE
jgi:predicted lipid-binding transport protein (Tim44 family)